MDINVDLLHCSSVFSSVLLSSPSPLLFLNLVLYISPLAHSPAAVSQRTRRFWFSVSSCSLRDSIWISCCCTSNKLVSKDSLSDLKSHRQKLHKHIHHPNRFMWKRQISLGSTPESSKFLRQHSVLPLGRRQLNHQRCFVPGQFCPTATRFL